MRVDGDKGWVAFDFDGTIAYSDQGAAYDPNFCGEPIPSMLKRVKDYLEAGYEVRILTARANDPAQIPVVKAWCLKHLGQELEVTSKKDYRMWILFDDRAIGVQKNTGKIIGADTNWISAVGALIDDLKSRHPEIETQGFTCPHLQKLDEMLKTSCFLPKELE